MSISHVPQSGPGEHIGSKGYFQKQANLKAANRTAPNVGDKSYFETHHNLHTANRNANGTKTAHPEANAPRTAKAGPKPNPRVNNGTYFGSHGSGVSGTQAQRNPKPPTGYKPAKPQGGTNALPKATSPKIVQAKALAEKGGQLKFGRNKGAAQ